MGIRLSPKHGLNPCIPKCFFCNEDKNEIVLPGYIPGDAEAPRNAVFDKVPCDKCQDYMRQGIILISVNEKLSEDLENPYRTGGFAVVKESAIREMVKPSELMEAICKKRVAFIGDDAWHNLGLPSLRAHN